MLTLDPEDYEALGFGDPHGTYTDAVFLRRKKRTSRKGFSDGRKYRVRGQSEKMVVARATGRAMRREANAKAYLLSLFEKGKRR